MQSHASLNRAYRLVWNSVRRLWVAVAETARGRGKQGRLLTAVVALAAAPMALGLPTGGQITTGTGEISQSGSQLTISQQSSKLAINWQGFNIGSNESVTFQQPDSSAIALNRILGQSASTILGKLNANGQVFLLNPNGVLFGSGAQVSVGGLLATTLGLSDSDFSAGHYSFSGNSSASIVNQGNISAAGGGYIALVGASVSNSGSLTARLGQIDLAGANGVTLQLANGTLAGFSVDQGSLQALVANHGIITADGGQILLSAQAANQLAKAAVNNDGIIEAQTVDSHGGSIRLLGDSGTVSVGGTLDASAPHGGNGGSIETSAATVQVVDGARITTAAPEGLAGTWLLDPQDFTIAASGGDITGATLSTELGSGNITIESTSGATAGSGNINVNAAVSWSANNTLTLDAINNINVNAAITATGNTAGLALNYGGSTTAASASSPGTLAAGNTSYTLGSGVSITLSGSSPSLSIGGNGYTVINSPGVAGDTSSSTLQGIRNNLGGNFALGSNINAAATSGWNSGAGFTPVGSSATPFSGIFDGLGHTVTGLTINTATASDVGLIGYSAGGLIQNVGLLLDQVAGNSNVGGLVGYADFNTTVNNAYATGSVTASANASNVGGLVGYSAGTVENSYASGAVQAATGSSNVGGLLGDNDTGGTVSNVYATGAVTATTSSDVGGLLGYSNGALTSAYATGAVKASAGSTDVGGLLGYNDSSATASTVYASGQVTLTGTGGSNIGGLLGYNNGTLSGAYATGAVTGDGGSYQGGLVGYNDYSGAISSSYATGAVTGGNGSTDVGGLAGYNNGAVSGSYASGTVTGSGGASDLGGLIGYGDARGAVTTSYYIGVVTGGSGSSAVGGLAGYNDGSIATSYTSATVAGSGGTNVGGLVGNNDSDGSITNTYAVGAVTGGGGSINVGGLVGDNSGKLSDSYATGAVSGGSSVGGLVGSNEVSSGGVTNSFWNTSSSGQSAGIGTDSNTTVTSTVTGLSATGIETASNYQSAGWNIATTGGGGSVWRIYNGNTAPLLDSLLTQLTITTTNQSETYNGTAYAVGAGISYSLASPAKAEILGSYGNAQGARNAGTYTLSAAGLYSTQQGYDINAGVASTLTITPLALSISGSTAASKTYNGTTADTITAGTLSGVLSGDTVNVASASGTFASKDAASNIAVTATYTLGGAEAVDYSLASQTLSAAITPLALSISGSKVTPKVYNAATNAAVTAGTLSGVVAGDNVSVASASGTFASKDVGTGISVATAYTLGGAQAGDYTLAGQTLSGTITPATLTLQSVSGTKDFDGGTALSKPVFAYVPLGTDQVTVSATAASFSQNAGVGLSVSASGLTLGGSNAADYTLASTSITSVGTGHIIAAPFASDVPDWSGLVSAPGASLPVAAPVVGLVEQAAISDSDSQERRASRLDASGAVRQMVSIVDNGVRLP